MNATQDTKKQLHPLGKLLIEAGPLAAFFFANAKYGIFNATAIFMVCMVASLTISYLLVRQLAIMPLVTCAFVLVFGGLTLWFNDDTFIKLKPTIVNSLFAAILFAGLALQKPILQTLMGEFIRLNPEGWKIFTFRWACFFLVLAVLNEFVWRNFSTDMWVSFKVFGILPLTIVFSISQMGLLSRYQMTDKTEN